MAEQTLNIPQLVVFILIAVLGVRWYLSKPSQSGTRTAPGQTHASRLNIDHVDRISQMFPHLDRRQIAWDLQRNGNNMAATTERVLSGRLLDTPPASFSIPPSRSNTPSRTPTPAAKPSQPDLITRYNLASKINASSELPALESQDKAKAWSQDRNERQANLQRRREEMILAARRKLEEKEKEKAQTTGATT